MTSRRSRGEPHGLTDQQLQLINRFPDQNPNPVMRMADDGTLIYANPASATLLEALAVSVGLAVPADLAASVRSAVADPARPVIEVLAGHRTYALLPVAASDLGFTTIYGTDVTALKALDKFPDQNPNPVLRVSHDGRLIYANPASAAIRESFGVRVGEALPAGVFRRITERLDPAIDDVMEVIAGELVFSVLVRSINEFGFINLYGTDVTAARQVERANELNRRLLLNILPERIADQLQAGATVIAERFDDVTLLFADIVDFTPMSSRMSATEVVDVLNAVFSTFDDLVERHSLEKIKTIGDAYMVVGGLPGQPHDHCARVATMALELAAEVEALEIARHHAIRFRIGMNSGPVVAGVIGRRKFIYDVWGDTVNTASRMESLGLPGRIQVTRAVRDRLGDRFRFEARGSIDVKGKGLMETWFLVGRDTDTVNDTVNRSSSPVPSA